MAIQVLIDEFNRVCPFKGGNYATRLEFVLATTDIVTKTRRILVVLNISRTESVTYSKPSAAQLFNTPSNAILTILKEYFSPHLYETV